MKNTCVWVGFFGLNFLSLYSLLWILVLLDASINGQMIPDAVFMMPKLLISSRIFLVTLEATVWLAATYLINRQILSRFVDLNAAGSVAKRIAGMEVAIIAFLVIYYIVTAII